MQPYRVVAVQDQMAGAVRQTLRSPGYGHPAHIEVATGHGPWGMLNAPATGLALTELIVDGAARSVDLRPFYPDRLPAARP